MIGPRITKGLHPGRVYIFLLDTVPAIVFGLALLWVLSQFREIHNFLGL